MPNVDRYRVQLVVEVDREAFRELGYGDRPSREEVGKRIDGLLRYESPFVYLSVEDVEVDDEPHDESQD
jgi:hypothetical protein